MPDEQIQGVARSTMTRRQLLHSGAVVGGTLVWTVPLVQAVMPAANAAGPGSGPPSNVHHRRIVRPPETTNLPFTGSDLPVVPALEVGAAATAVGVVLSQIKKRSEAARSDEE